MADRSIVVRLRAEVGQYKQALAEAQKATDQVGDAQDEIGKKSQDAQKQAVQAAQQQREAWDTVGSSLLAVGAGVAVLGVSILKTGIEYNTLQQTARASLTTLLGSSKAAADQMDRLDDFARNSPFSKSTFIEAQGQMLAFGIEARKVVPYLDAIQNAVAAAGGSNDDIAGIVATMSKVQSSAKITAEDLNELGGRGINAAELIGSQMGKTGAQIREEITSGSLDATAALDALAAGMSEKFDGAADNVKNTFAGAMDRIMAAWRDLSSALAEPFVGKDGGGIFTALLNETADLMRTFEDLPAPVRGGIAVTTALTGVTAIATGAYLKFAPKVAEARAQLELLRGTAPLAASAITGVGRAAQVATSALVILGAAKTLGNLLDGEVAGADQFETALSRLTTGSRSARDELEKLATFEVGGWTDKLQFGGEANWQKDIRGLSDAISTFDMPRADRIGDWLNGIARTSRSEAGSTIVDNVDKALAKMVSEGNADKAAEGFRYFADQAADSGVSIKGAKDMLPGYTAALEEADAAARNSGYVTADLADTVARLTEEWYANANAALGLSNAQIGAAEALVRANELAAEGARISYDQSGAFNLMDESTRNAVGGLNALAEANLLANEQIRQMYGEDSPQLQAALAAQRESFIQAGIQFGLTREQAAAYADQLGQIPTAPATTASLAKAADWDKTYFEIMTGLDGLARTRTAKINVSAGIGLGGLAGVGAPALTSLLLGDSYAEGGQISGPGSGTSDSILARVSNGEHVLTAADVRAMGGQQNVYKFRETLHSYATGGAVDYRAAAHAIPVSQMAHADTSPSSQTFNTTVVGRPTASDWSIAQKVATQLAWQMKASGGVG